MSAMPHEQNHALFAGLVSKSLTDAESHALQAGTKPATLDALESTVGAVARFNAAWMRP